MITSILAKIFGTKNERDLRNLQPIVEHINSLEPSVAALSDEQLAAKTVEFRQRFSQGATLDVLLPEVFAVVREVGKRTMNQRHFDVQLIGGTVLHQGKISEMRTGEGKTLTATLALCLNAISGKGAHLITVNDYLARRDAEWMSPIYSFLGLEVGIIQNSMSDAERKTAYAADITYGTNNEFGFDYLRDNMKFDLADYVQRDLNFAIVDEVDSILIDEARTPLIISGPSERHSNLYETANKAVLQLIAGEFEIDEKERAVTLTDAGVDKMEHVLKVQNLYAPENILVLHHVTQALRAQKLFKLDVEYVVRDNEVLIVDEFTGRILPGRRYSDGLHQAIEAKEGVKIERENQTLASITLQNYFRLYKKLAGMTGTAVTEAAEFHKIYKLGVIVVPTNMPIARRDEGDIVFLTRDDKFKAAIEDIKDCHKRGQPVLVGTISIEASEYLSHLLDKDGIPHNVLNAKQHAREAEIIKEAGEKGRVTIATNMAGRGTDIKINDEVKSVGGLRIIGTERHESRRIDNQLRGRSGRQGDPGSSKFYISLEDDLMRIFGGDRLKKTMERLGMKPGESIEHSMATRSIEKAQERLEKHNFDIRKHLLEYDDVLNQQRMVIYQYRREILDGADRSKEIVRTMIADVVEQTFGIYAQRDTCDVESWNNIAHSFEKLVGVSRDIFDKNNFGPGNATVLQSRLIEFLTYEYEQFRGAIDASVVDEAEKWILLETVDHAWKMHLLNIDHIKEGIGLRGYGQKNPLIEYKKESFFEFERMIQRVTWDIVHRVFKMKPEDFSAATIRQIEAEKEKELASIQVGGDSMDHPSTPLKREAPKVGRNDSCPCGSGKKFKHCCGA